MFTKSTLRNVMSAMLVLIIASTMMPAVACEQEKKNCQPKILRPLSAVVNGIKHLLGGNGNSSKHEPSVDDDYVTDYSELPITP